MSGYFIRRLLLVVPVLFGVSLFTFILFFIVPGDPVLTVAGERATPETIARIRAELGLDKPLPVQYVTWVGKALKGDLGRSFLTGRSITESLQARFPVTLRLAVFSMAIAVATGIPAGVWAAVHKGTWVDAALRNVSLLGACTPVIFQGLALQYVFGVWLGWLPVSGIGDGSWRHYLLPALVLGTNIAAYQARLSRAVMLEVLDQDYIRTAWAKGLSQRVVVYKHGLRNALIPVVTTLGGSLGSLLVGSALTETIFALPGIGSYTLDAVFARDLPVVMGAFLFQAVVFVGINVLLDGLYVLIDPRVRYD
ncbi:MAG: ABC transporter permease [Limnochordales bacterium]